MVKKPAKKQAAKSKVAKKKAPAPSGTAMSVMAMRAAMPGGAHPDHRLPLVDDDTHEMLCKWDAQSNEYQCQKVAKGGDWGS
jgi:hypothetical protein